MYVQEIPLSAPLRLWHVDLNGLLTPAAQACLSLEEQVRAERFVFSQDRARYEAARAALRHMLSRVAGVAPKALRFAYGPSGKPLLVGAFPIQHFNLSHSACDAVIVSSDRYEVGVDIEVLRCMPDAAELAKSCFTASECDELATASPEKKDRIFLTCWTRKEACLKALGTGFDLDPRTVEVGAVAESRSVSLMMDGIGMRIKVQSFVHLQKLICAVAYVLDASSSSNAKRSARDQPA